MLTHDALIGVQDRHHENGGVIVQREVGGPRPGSRRCTTAPEDCFATRATRDWPASRGVMVYSGSTGTSRDLVPLSASMASALCRGVAMSRMTSSLRLSSAPLTGQKADLSFL